MSNISEKQLMEAVKDLKSWCRQHRVLVGECKCPFNDGGVCSITDAAVPCEIKVPCRWTDDDYCLAKILDRGYASWIERSYDVSDTPVKWFGYNSEGKECSGDLPEGCFDALKTGERKYLSGIVTEYEECSNIEEWQSLDLNGNIHDSL